MGWPPSSLSERLMSSLPGSARPTTARRLRPILGQLLQISPAFAARFAALVVVVLILAEAALIANVLTREHAYQLASGLHEDGLAALIAFADDATASDIARFLTDFEANIVDGPKPGGIYKIRLRNLDKSQPMGDALLNKLAQRRDIVRIVLPSRDWGWSAMTPTQTAQSLRARAGRPANAASRIGLSVLRASILLLLSVTSPPPAGRQGSVGHAAGTIGRAAHFSPPLQATRDHTNSRQAFGTAARRLHLRQPRQPGARTHEFAKHAGHRRHSRPNFPAPAHGLTEPHFSSLPHRLQRTDQGQRLPGPVPRH